METTSDKTICSRLVAHISYILVTFDTGELNIVSRSARPVWIRPSGSLGPFLRMVDSVVNSPPPSPSKKKKKKKKEKKKKKKTTATTTATATAQDKKMIAFAAICTPDPEPDSDDGFPEEEEESQEAPVGWTIEYCDGDSQDAKLALSDGRSIFVIALPSACAGGGGSGDASHVDSVVVSSSSAATTALSVAASRSAGQRMRVVLDDAVAALLRRESTNVDPTFVSVPTDQTDTTHMRDVEAPSLAAWRLAMAASLHLASLALSSVWEIALAEAVASMIASAPDDRRVISTFNRAIQCSWMGCIRSRAGGLETTTHGAHADAMSDVYDRLPEALHVLRLLLGELGVPGIDGANSEGGSDSQQAQLESQPLRSTAAMHVLRSAEKNLAPVGDTSKRGPGFVNQWVALTVAARGEASLKGDPMRANVGEALLHFLATQQRSSTALHGMWDLNALTPSSGEGTGSGSNSGSSSVGSTPSTSTQSAALWRGHGAWFNANAVDSLRFYTEAGALGLASLVSMHLVQYEPAKALALFPKRRWAQLATGAAMEARPAGGGAGGDAVASAMAAEGRAVALLARTMALWLLHRPIVVPTPPYADRAASTARGATAAGSRLDAAQLAALVSSNSDEWSVRRASSLLFAAAVLAAAENNRDNGEDGDAAWSASTTAPTSNAAGEASILWIGAVQRHNVEVGFPKELLHELSVAVQFGEMSHACHSAVVHELVLHALESGTLTELQSVRFVGRLLLSQRSAMRRPEVVSAGSAALEIVLHRLCEAVAQCSFEALAVRPSTRTMDAVQQRQTTTSGSFKSSVMRAIESGMHNTSSGRRARASRCGRHSSRVAELATQVLELISHVGPLKSVLQRLTVTSGAALLTLARSIVADGIVIPQLEAAPMDHHKDAEESPDVEASGMVAMAVLVLWSLHTRESLASAAAMCNIQSSSSTSKAANSLSPGAAAVELVRWTSRLAQVIPIVPFPREAIAGLLLSLLTQTVAVAPRATSEALDRYFTMDTLRCLPDSSAREDLRRRFRRLRKEADLGVAALRSAHGGKADAGGIELVPEITPASKMPSLSPAQRAVSDVGSDETFKAFIRVISGWCQRDAAAVTAAATAAAAGGAAGAAGEKKSSLRKTMRPRSGVDDDGNKSFDDMEWRDLEDKWDAEETEWLSRQGAWKKSQGIQLDEEALPSRHENSSGSSGSSGDDDDADGDRLSGDSALSPKQKEHHRLRRKKSIHGDAASGEGGEGGEKHHRRRSSSSKHAQGGPGGNAVATATGPSSSSPFSSQRDDGRHHQSDASGGGVGEGDGGDERSNAIRIMRALELESQSNEQGDDVEECEVGPPPETLAQALQNLHSAAHAAFDADPLDVDELVDLTEEMVR